MFHTIEYKPGWFIHCSYCNDGCNYKHYRWQGPNGEEGTARTFQGAQRAITKKISLQKVNK